MINEEHSHQIQQEQDRDFNRAEGEIAFLLDRIEDLSRYPTSVGSQIIVEYVNEIRNLIKMLGVNI